jgi:hypothetical protein
VSPQFVEHARCRVFHGRVVDKARRHLFVRIDDDRRPFGRQHGERLGIRRNHQIGAEQEIDLPMRNTHAMDAIAVRRDADM